jgi:uncharacterized protein
MSEAVFESAWRYLFPDGVIQRGRSIRLGSGEPLLAIDLLRKIHRRIARAGGSEKDGRPYVFLTTNGSLCSPSVRDWLVASGWQVKISLDGPADVHDRWRVTKSGRRTFARAASAVEDLAGRMPERLSVAAVLCRGADPDGVFEAIAGLGVRRIEFVPAAHSDASILPGAEDAARYAEFIDRYARRMIEKDDPGLPVLVRFENCVQKVMGYGIGDLPCGAGRSYFGVGPDGGLFPCFRFVGIERFRLGRLPSGLDRTRTSAFIRGPGRRTGRRTSCRRCAAAALCGGPCFAVAEAFGAGRPLDIHCAFIRTDARAARLLVEDLRVRRPERLLRFLPGGEDLLSSL